jgi:hypothetical protein
MEPVEPDELAAVIAKLSGRLNAPSHALVLITKPFNMTQSLFVVGFAQCFDSRYAALRAV